MAAFGPKKRRKARMFLVQALYQWQLTGDDYNEVTVRFLVEMNRDKCDSVYFRDVMKAICADISAIDTMYSHHLDREQRYIGPIETAILRLGSFELAQRVDIPYRVVVNEAIELAKTFAPEEAYKYINGILDKVALQYRQLEKDSEN